MPITKKFAQRLIRTIFAKQDLTLSNNLEIALYTSAPTLDGGGTEVTGGGYRRVSIERSGDSFEHVLATARSYTSNKVKIKFPAATADWGTVTHFGLHSVESGTDNLLAYGELSEAKNIHSGDGGPQFGVDALKFYLDGR